MNGMARDLERLVKTLCAIVLGERPDPAMRDGFVARIRAGGPAILPLRDLRHSHAFFDRLGPVVVGNANLAARLLEALEADGDAAMARGDNTAAMTCLDLAIALAPEQARLLVRRGRVCALLGRHLEAADCFEAALSLEPGLADAEALRAVALCRAGNPRQAAASIERVRALATDRPEAALASGLMLAALDRHEEALAMLDAACRQGDSPEIASATASSLVALGRDAEALAAWERAIALAPGDSAPVLARARVLDRMGRDDEALAALDAALALNPRDADAWFSARALVARRLGLPGRVGVHELGVTVAPSPRPVTYLIYSATTAATLKSRLGKPEYSYFFVAEAFRKVLARRASCIVVSDPEAEVDEIAARVAAAGGRCVLLSFAPPHRALLEVGCPQIPLFAWEYDTAPTDDCGGGPLDDWRIALARMGCAVTHSTFAARAVAPIMYPGFPVLSIPAPIWDGLRASPLAAPAAGAARTGPLEVRARQVMDCVTIEGEREITVTSIDPRDEPVPVTFAPDEVVFTTVFNPEDARKNWVDMLRAFRTAFAGDARATLVLKLVHNQPLGTMLEVQSMLQALPALRCRIVVIGDHLDDDDYAALIAATDYAVNTSFGEGQCLPLMEYMTLGKPAVAPAHTSMAEYIDEDCAFVIAHHREPAPFLHDVDWTRETTHRHRIDWDSAVAAFRAALDTATTDRARYARMAAAAVESQRRFCSEAVCLARLDQLVALKLSLDAAHAPLPGNRPAVIAVRPAPPAGSTLPARPKGLAELEARIREVEADRARAVADREWLGRYYRALASAPRWWVIMPARWRRRREAARLRTMDVFDGNAYRRRNPDVAAAGGDPLRHYLQHGLAEGRDRE